MSMTFEYVENTRFYTFQAQRKRRAGSSPATGTNLINVNKYGTFSNFKPGVVASA